MFSAKFQVHVHFLLLLSIISGNAAGPISPAGASTSTVYRGRPPDTLIYTTRCRPSQRRATLFLIRSGRRGVVGARMIRGRAPDPPVEIYADGHARGDGKNGT